MSEQIRLPAWAFQPDEDTPGLYLACESVFQREAVMRLLGWMPQEAALDELIRTAQEDGFYD